MPKTSSSGAVNTRIVAIAGCAVLVIVAALALPRFIGGGDDVVSEDGTLLRDRIAARSDTEAGPSDADPEPETTPATRDAPEQPTARIDVDAADPASAGGDLSVGVRLRWESYPTGSPIQATVDIVNRDDTAVWIPAPREPQPTITLRVLDESGATVRQVVERVDDPLPRRMYRLEPGATATVALEVIARGEEPLPPGRYQLAAAFDAEKAWRRSGLPVWTAPDGARYSDRVEFEITDR